MSLADQIIEHGPYRDGDSLPIEVQVADAEEVNALRDELLELRRLRAAAEARELVELEVDRWADPIELDMDHTGCCDWILSFTGAITLAELVRRADEHTEGCR